MNDWIMLALLLALPQATGLVIGRATRPDTWYRRLEKPTLTPPSWVFGPVWTALYLFMGVAAFLLWQEQAWEALILWTVQLALNGLWSLLFFRLQSIVLALIDLLALDILVAWLVLRAFAVSTTAGALLSACLLWILFATYLNAAFLVRNG